MRKSIAVSNIEPITGLAIIVTYKAFLNIGAVDGGYPVAFRSFTNEKPVARKVVIKY